MGGAACHCRGRAESPARHLQELPVHCRPMSIWQVHPSLEQLQDMRRGSMVEYVDIRFTEIGPDYLRASMPVDHRTLQTMGILHGGASVVLAETVGSTAANLCLD